LTSSSFGENAEPQNTQPQNFEGRGASADGAHRDAAGVDAGVWLEHGVFLLLREARGMRAFTLRKKSTFLVVS
jgi:hypothetical protein